MNSSSSNQDKQKNSNLVEYKVIICGDTCVGKTSILFRYLHNSFSDIQLSTVSSQGYVIEIDLKNGKPPIRLSVWDTAGQEQYNSIVKVFFREADAVVLVFDVTNENTFTNLKKWHDIASANCPSNSLYFIAGNKIDLPYEQHISDNTEIANMQKCLGATSYVSCSAKSGEGVPELFELIAKNVSSINKNTNNNVNIEKDEKKSKKCC